MQLKEDKRMQSVPNLTKCEVCGHRRKQVLRMRWMETFTVCRTCAIDRYSVTPEQWRKAWAKRSPNDTLQGSPEAQRKEIP